MGTPSQKKGIVLALGTLFGIRLIGALYNTVSVNLDFLSSVAFSSVWAALYLLLLIVTAMTARRRQLFTSALGPVCAYGLAALFGLIIINCIVVLATDKSFFESLGPVFGLALEIIQAVLTIFYIWTMKTWLPIKISGIIPSFCYMISSALSTKIAFLTESGSPMSDMMKQINSLSALYGAISIIALLTNLLAFILIIVWFNRKDDNSHSAHGNEPNGGAGR